jgi:outer membrane lipoprotein-sorting protein
MMKLRVVVAGACILGLQAAVWAGGYTETSIKDYIAPLEADHKKDEEKKGLEIYKQQYLIDEGWQSLEARMDMLLVDATGHESHRSVVKRMIEDGNQPDKTLGIFLEPADVRGTIMLTFEQSYGSDEQWLYLPSLKRTKKINAENKSGSFLGTEFSWEDISTSELTKFHYRLVRDDGSAWVVERTPVYKFSGYARELTWVNKANYQTVKIEYYDKKGDLLKTQTMDKWEQYKSRYWRPLKLEMVNHVNHKKTVIELSPYRVSVDLDKRMFSSLGLDQIRLSEVAASAK